MFNIISIDVANDFVGAIGVWVDKLQVDQVHNDPFSLIKKKIFFS